MEEVEAPSMQSSQMVPRISTLKATSTDLSLLGRVEPPAPPSSAASNPAALSRSELPAQAVSENVYTVAEVPKALYSRLNNTRSRISAYPAESPDITRTLNSKLLSPSLKLKPHVPSVLDTSCLLFHPPLSHQEP